MKYLFLLALLPATLPAAQAQNRPSPSLGVKAGASLSGLTNRNLASDRYLWGFHAGVTGNLSLTTTFSVQAEALYSQKGFQDDIVAGGTTYVNRLRLHYLDVPVLARLSAKGGFIEAGPQLGMLLTAHGHNGFAAGIPEDYTATDGYYRVDVGLAGGLGYQLASGPGIGLRYNAGLVNVSRYNNSGTALRNTTFQLYLNYQLGKR